MHMPMATGASRWSNTGSLMRETSGSFHRHSQNFEWYCSKAGLPHENHPLIVIQ